MQPWNRSLELELRALHPVRRGIIRAQQTFWVVLLSRSASRRTRSGPADRPIEEDELPAFNPMTNPMGDFVTAT